MPKAGQVKQQTPSPRGVPPAGRSADPGSRGQEIRVYRGGKVEPQAPPPRGVPATRPAEREKARVPEPKTAPVPKDVGTQAPPPRSVPPAGRSADPGSRGQEIRVYRGGKVEPQAPPPRDVPASRPPEPEKTRVPEPMSAPVPGKVELQAPPPRGVPATRPAEREKVREVEPKEDRSGGPPAGRSPDPGVRGPWWR